MLRLGGRKGSCQSETRCQLEQKIGQSVILSVFHSLHTCYYSELPPALQSSLVFLLQCWMTNHPVNKRCVDVNTDSLEINSVCPWWFMHNRLRRDSGLCAEGMWRSEGDCRCFWQRWHLRVTSRLKEIWSTFSKQKPQLFYNFFFCNFLLSFYFIQYFKHLSTAGNFTAFLLKKNTSNSDSEQQRQVF